MRSQMTTLLIKIRGQKGSFFTHSEYEKLVRPPI